VEQHDRARFQARSESSQHVSRTGSLQTITTARRPTDDLGPRELHPASSAWAHLAHGRSKPNGAGPRRRFDDAATLLDVRTYSARPKECVEPVVIEAVQADRVPLGHHALQELGFGQGPLAQDKERCPRAAFAQHVEHKGRRDRIGPIVEGQGQPAGCFRHTPQHIAVHLEPRRERTPSKQHQVGKTNRA